MILTLAFYLAIGAAIVLPAINHESVKMFRAIIPPILPEWAGNLAICIGTALTILTWPLLLVSAMLRRG